MELLRGILGGIQDFFVPGISADPGRAVLKGFNPQGLWQKRR